MRHESKIVGPIPEPRNKWKNDMIYYTVSRLILTFIGIWPTDQQSSIFGKVMTATRIVICYFFILFVFIPCALHTFLEEKDIRAKPKLIAPMIFYVAALIKYSLLVTRTKDIHQCLDHIFVDWQQGSSSTDHQIMLKCVKFNRFIAGVFTIITYSSGLFFRLALPLSGGKRVGPNNITIRPLGNPIYRPLFTADDSPSYEIVYSLQIMTTLVVCGTTTGASSLAAMFVLHACGQLKLIMSRLDNIFEGSECSENILENRMAEIIELHLRVLNFIRHIESILNEVCLVEFTAAMLVLCLTVYNLSMDIQQAAAIALGGYSVIILSVTFNIFILCYFGEMLDGEVKNVGSTAYMIDWYKLPETNGRGLILLLAMTHYPCRITAGKIVELSYRSFSGLLKTSMGYFNLLRTVAS